ncbi:hypothetical protein CEUSTIGMA_g5297.t1 [Chlamydomonas eustigma]|uniref:Uncharacterized protein n=1 Tax=Chlamydomonas eustigma TaxID=1157962 RepID=A0A250X459_9CHLO|nr:hypothetical protein CEUSTIGMA_g5297.t1 [Chlamydomonas eustigma]|eukprot:GAX77855.1 hypothetical protein CEUSTIGMA_g5297.t1 [Chlamydomonas eustigma]
MRTNTSSSGPGTESGPGIITVSSGSSHVQQKAIEEDLVMISLRTLAIEQHAPGLEGNREVAALKEDLRVSTLLKGEAESLSEDILSSLQHYQLWLNGKLQQVAAKQCSIHMQIEEAESKAVDASRRIDKLTQDATGINNQFIAISKLPGDIDNACSQLQALNLQFAQLQELLIGQHAKTGGEKQSLRGSGLDGRLMNQLGLRPGGLLPRK